MSRGSGVSLQRIPTACGVLAKAVEIVQRYLTHWALGLGMPLSQRRLTSAHGSRFSRRALADSDIARPPAAPGNPVGPHPLVDTIVDTLRLIYASDQPSFQATADAAARLLATVADSETRVRILERLGSRPIPPLQFVDDTLVASPTCTQANSCIQAARRDYAERVRAAFNDAPDKTAMMAFACDAAAARGMRTQHRSLGILIDTALTFEPFLSEKVRIGRATFLSLLHAAETSGFSIPVIILAQAAATTS